MNKILKTLVAFVAGAALLVGSVMAQDRQGWPRSLTIGTASQGGVYYVYGNGLAGFIGEQLKINASAEVTGGPTINATLVQNKELNIGMVSLGPMYDAWTGKSPLAPGLKHTDVRALFAMYETPFHAIALRRSNIRSIADLRGKRVSVGPAGGTSDSYWPRFLRELGVNATITRNGAAESASQLKDGLIDAFLFAAGLPIGAFSQLAAEANVVTFAFSPAEHARIVRAFPEVSPFKIPANTYTAQKTEQNSVAMWNYVIVHKDMPESLAYEITKLVLENNPHMVRIHPAARGSVLQNWNNNSFLPFHKGAVRYYQSKGITIPANLRD